jgi:predicted HTH transcriptional regulator
MIKIISTLVAFLFLGNGYLFALEIPEGAKSVQEGSSILTTLIPFALVIVIIVVIVVNINKSNKRKQELTANNAKQESVIINVTAPIPTPQLANEPISMPQIIPVAQTKISAEKEIIALADKTPILTLRQIMSSTNLDVEEIKNAIKNLISKGMAKEEVDPSGKSTYTFNE